MKLREKYALLKKENSDYIIIIKSGSFYITYDNDATILNYIFSYQIVNGKVGFPINNLDKVTNELHIKSIDYIIYNNEDSNIIKIKNEQNNYVNYFEQAKRLEFKSTMDEMLLSRIKFLLENNEENYYKIRRFIDEL